MTVRNLEQGRGTVAPLIAILAALEHRFGHQPPNLGLGDWLREVRRGMRLSQERLTFIAGVSKPSVIQIERDRGHVQTLIAVMRALDLRVALAPFEQVSGSPGSAHVQVHVGDCREVLARMPPKLFHASICSPPYFQQRDYAADGQIGMEASPDEYVTNLVAVFREVRRVLRDDGTLWLVLGDAFARNSAHSRRRKELLGLPWRAAFALQDDGWFLRQDIILNKTNGLPEPVKDRLVRAHEYLFLFTKGQRYHFNAAALRERGVSINPGTRQRNTRETRVRFGRERRFECSEGADAFRNRRAWVRHTPQTVGLADFQPAHALRAFRHLSRGSRRALRSSGLPRRRARPRPLRRLWNDGRRGSAIRTKRRPYRVEPGLR